MARYVLANNITIRPTPPTYRARWDLSIFEDHPSHFSRQSVSSLQSSQLSYYFHLYRSWSQVDSDFVFCFCILFSVPCGSASRPLPGRWLPNGLSSRTTRNRRACLLLGRADRSISSSCALCHIRILWFLVPMFIKNGQIDLQRSIDIFCATLSSS